jgi:predicted N-acyltransferase
MTLRFGAALGWTVVSHTAIDQIPADDWDTCVGPDNPLMMHWHLLALEESGIAAPENGVEPCHVVLRDGSGEIVAAVPAYLKGHSRGELGVDLGLSLAHARSVGSYYPKLQIEVPMTPFAGRRFLVRTGVDRGMAVHCLILALQAVAESMNASSVQFAHMENDEDLETLVRAGCAITETNSYVWRPQGDRSFEDMLARMKSSSRSEIKRQRRRIEPLGLTFAKYRGPELSDDMVAPFFARYQANFDRHATPMWLNEDYFRRVFRAKSDSVELSVSSQDEEWAGVCFNVLSAFQGYIMYWGQSSGISFLHFEQVIYRNIERALALGLRKLDFGPTGAHKAERGIGIEPVYHALWFRDPTFAEVVSQACSHKRRAALVERYHETARLPYAIKV